MYGFYGNTWFYSFLLVLCLLLFTIVRLIFRRIMKKTPVFDFFSKFIFFAFVLIIPFSAMLSFLITHNNYYLGFLFYSLYVTILFLILYFHSKNKNVLWLLIVPIIFLTLSSVVFSQVKERLHNTSTETNSNAPTKSTYPLDLSPSLGGCGEASTF